MSYPVPYSSCPAAIIKDCSQWVDDPLQEKQDKRDLLKSGIVNHLS